MSVVHEPKKYASCRFYSTKHKINQRKSIGYNNLIFGCVSFILFYSFQSLPIVADVFFAYICGYFVPFFYVEILQSLDITWVPLVNIDFQQFPQILKGLGSGYWLGQERTSISPSWSHFFLSLAVCLGSWSSWSSKSWPCPNKSADLEKLFFKNLPVHAAIHPAINNFWFSRTFGR